MRERLWGAALACAIASGCDVDYQCGSYVYDPAVELCVCPMGTTALDGGGCALGDGGVIYPPGWEGGAPAIDAAGVDATAPCPGGGSMQTVYADEDDDGHGSPASARMGCPGEPNVAVIGDDCDDGCADCYPGSLEICDSRDNDCANGADDTFTCVRGTATACDTTCGSTGIVTCGLDCAIAPSATCTPPAETCNDVDDDCDGLVDEGVTAFGPPITWDVSGVPLSVERVGDGGVVVFPGPERVGLFATRFGPDGTLVGAPIMIASRHVDSWDTAVVESRIVVAFTDGDGIYLAEIDAGDLTTRVAARALGSRPGADSIQVEHAGPAFILAYEGSSGAILSRGIVSTAVDTGTERVIVASRSTTSRTFDLHAGPASLGRAYIAYSDIPPATAMDATTDEEIFIAAVDFATGLEAAPLRVTTNGSVDKEPTLHLAAAGALGVAWVERTGATNGPVRIAVISPSTPGSWSVSVRSADGLGSAHSLFVRQTELLSVGDRWFVAYPALGASGQSEQRLSIASSSLELIEADLVPAPLEAGQLDIMLALLPEIAGGVVAVATVRTTLDLGSGTLRLHPLRCR